jgi:hypothetical protein
MREVVLLMRNKVSQRAIGSCEYIFSYKSLCSEAVLPVERYCFAVLAESQELALEGNLLILMNGLV